jgi:hypothetical protein
MPLFQPVSLSTIKVNETAGENLVAGDLAYLNTDGKYWKASVSSTSTGTSKLLLANATINADAVGEFIAFGTFTTSGLTAGSVYFMSTAGGISTAAPTTQDYVIRPIGTASSTTTLEFDPSVSWATYKA